MTRRNTQNKTANWWQSQTITQDEQRYLRAVRSMAVMLNCAFDTSQFSLSALKNQKVYFRRQECLARQPRTNSPRLGTPEFDQAENLFYGDLSFGCLRGFKNITSHSSLNTSIS
jgi:hypothetical protein